LERRNVGTSRTVGRENDWSDGQIPGRRFVGRSDARKKVRRMVGRQEEDSSDGWMVGRSDGRTVGWLDGWKVGRSDGRTVGRSDGLTVGHLEEDWPVEHLKVRRRE
jgi:hypothetical protein